MLCWAALTIHEKPGILTRYKTKTHDGLSVHSFNQTKTLRQPFGQDRNIELQ